MVAFVSVGRAHASFRITSLVRRLVPLIVFLSAALQVMPAAGQVGQWTAHTSMRRALSIDSAPTRVWVGTTGGLFSVDRATSEIDTYTIVQGLHAVSASNVAWDEARGVIWIGYDDGALDRLDPATGTVQTYRDIQRAVQFSSRRVNRMALSGDSLYVATDFGLVVFDAERTEVRDSYSRFGSFSAAIPVLDFAFGPLDDGRPGIWVATQEGIASAATDVINLQDPAVWAAEATPGQSQPLSIAAFADSIYVGTEAGLIVRTDVGSFSERGTIERPVYSLRTLPDRVVGASEFLLFQVDGLGTVTNLAIEGGSLPSDVTVDDSGRIWVADRESGAVLLEAIPANQTSIEPSAAFFPDGPRDGLFSSADAGSDGSVVFGGVAGPGRGFYHRDPSGEWTSYVRATHPDIGDRASFFIVDADNTGAVWAGSQGGGVVRVDASGEIVRYDETNSSLEAVSGLPGFILVGGIDGDTDMRTWVTTLGSPAPIHVRSTDGSWTGLLPYIGQGLTALSSAYGSLFVDSFDQKWVIVRDESSFSNTRGLLVIDTGGDPLDQSDDSFRFFNSVGGSGQGLPSTTVTAVVEDRAGLVWIGTDRGLAYAVNTGFVAQDQNSVLVWPQQADRDQGPFVFFGLPITALAVDPANRLWVGTNEGVRIIESVEGGFREVREPITTANAPLPSDAILAIAIDAGSGEVYIVTDAGTVSTSGDAVEPVIEIAELFVYPNPADYTTGDPEIFIEGLSEASTVTIVSAAGARIRRLAARGGRIRWDGRDERGSPVPSGVYVVVAVGADGSGTGYGKVAVIR